MSFRAIGLSNDKEANDVDITELLCGYPAGEKASVTDNVLSITKT